MHNYINMLVHECAVTIICMNFMHLKKAINRATVKNKAFGRQGICSCCDILFEPQIIIFLQIF